MLYISPLGSFADEVQDVNRMRNKLEDKDIMGFDASYFG